MNVQGVFCKIIGLCYPHGNYTPTEIDYVRRMNLLINTWDVPSANFLGALDDTSGGWAVGYENDPGHPNTEGHKEMFYTIVPSVFEALETGKPIPTRLAGDGSLALGGQNGKIVFEPKDFSIGGKESCDYKHWMVYRSALNEMEVNALYEGKLLQASLEVYAPLQDKNLEDAMAVKNRAQSMSEAIYKIKFGL